MLDAKRLMAADELPRDLLDEWLANADALFRLLKVGMSSKGLYEWVAV